MTTATPLPSDSDFFARVDAALPIDDLVGWLLREYPHASERDVMALLQKIYERDYAIGPSGEPERRYEVGDDGWTAFPQRVARKAAP
jgi:hypothetical protein